MKARETALRTKKFEADEQSKKIANLDYMIRDFVSMANDLDRQIQAEEERTGVRDTGHFAYSTFAKSAAQRRDNLRASASELTIKLEAATKARDEAVDEIAQATTPAPRETQRVRQQRPDRSAPIAAR